MQLHVETMSNVRHVFWWKSYSPPLWLLDGKIESMTTTDLMGMQKESMIQEISNVVSCSAKQEKRQGIYLVAPWSATYLDRFVLQTSEAREVQPQGELFLVKSWEYRQHLNLDDLDFGDDGVVPTLKRVVGRRGLVLYEVRIKCRGDIIEEEPGQIKF